MTLALNTLNNNELAYFSLESIELDIEIGIHHSEIGKKQRILVDVSVGVSNSLTNIEDTKEGLSSGYDYSQIYEAVRGAAKKSTNLIETLANRIAESILLNSDVVTCTVKVTKLRLWEDVARISVLLSKSKSA
jgi:dihydroneopterin aldolase